MTVRIVAHSDYMNKTLGLCGKFDGLSTTDRIGRDGLHKTTLAEMAQSWNEESGDCLPNEIPDSTPRCTEVY